MANTRKCDRYNACVNRDHYCTECVVCSSAQVPYPFYCKMPEPISQNDKKLVTKVKAFSSDNIVDLESRLNDFIKDKDIVDIKYQSFILDGRLGLASSIVDRALVIYKE